VAAVLTACVIALHFRGGQHPTHTASDWTTPLNLGLHGWSLIASVALYGYLCWLAFWFIRGTQGRERLFVVGWCVEIPLMAVRALRPEWASIIGLTRTIGLIAALLVAILLLLRPAEVVDHGERGVE